MQKAKQNLGEILSAMEFMDTEAFRLPFRHFPDLKNPFPDSADQIYLLIETLGSNNAHDRDKLNSFLEASFNEGMAVDGVVAQDTRQIQAMWKIRECITEALTLRGLPARLCDISDPLLIFQVPCTSMI